MDGLVLGKQNLDLSAPPSDVIPPQGRGDMSVDKDRVIGMFMEDFRNDIRYKEDMGWVKKKEYNLKAYYQQKEEAWKYTPWKGASAYRSPLTATLVDTGCAFMQQSIIGENGNPVQIKNTGVEDLRTSKILELYLNNCVEMPESNFRQATDMNIFRMFLNGTGVMKGLRTLNDEGVEFASIDIENIFVPLGARGFKIGQTDHVIHIIPLTRNEIEYRRAMKVYEGIERMPSGAIIAGNAKEAKTSVIDNISGTGMNTYNNEIYYIAEYYKTYWNKDSMRPVEIIAWISPAGGMMFRIKENKPKIRPFSRHVIYETEDNRFFGISLPEKVREIQEKLDYSDKQLTDAYDKSNMPAMFVDDTSGFDSNLNQRVPGGVYQVGVGRKIDYEPIPHVERGFDNERFNMWSQAEKLSGLIDVIQGASTKSGRTLGETNIRTDNATLRFKSLVKRYEIGGFNDTINILYGFQNLYVPREKKIKLIGYADYTTIDEIFPSKEQQFFGLGLDGNPNFILSNKTPLEKDEEIQNLDALYERAMLNPVVASVPANCWRLLKEWSEKRGIRIENLFPKPKEAYLLSANEFIERILSGQYNLELRPGVDYENYQFEIMLFMRSEQFKVLEPEAQQALQKALEIVQVFIEADRKAKMQMMVAQNFLQQRNQVEAIQAKGGMLPPPPSPEQGQEQGVSAQEMPLQ